MEGYIMWSKRLTPTVVGKIVSKCFVVVEAMGCVVTRLCLRKDSHLVI